MASVNVRTGTEGPSHDPYGYTEIEFTRTDGVVVTYHAGLGEWCKVSLTPPEKRRGVRHHGEDLIAHCIDDDGAASLFETATGLSPQQAEKVYQRLHGPQRRCPHCGGRKFSWHGGYVGEAMQCCTACDRIVYCEPVTLSMIE